MNVLGHVFIWLIALGAVAATILTAKTYDVRNSWIKKVDQLKQDVEKNKPIIADKEAQLEALHAEKNNINLGWGEPFLNVQGQLIDQPTLQFSTNDPGVMNWLGALDQAQQAAQVVYVFQPQPDESSLYIGSFQFAGPNPGGGILFSATWTPRNEDFARITNPNGLFRVRPLVPSHFPKQYADMRGQMTIAERLLTDKQDDLAEQKQREADAQTILDTRTAQLEGPEGLVSQLQSAEDASNAELEELDYWRRQVDDARKKIEELIKENRSLEQQLESPAEPEPAVTAQVAGP